MPKNSERRIKSSWLRNHVAANKPGLTQQHKEARISFALEYLLKDEASWSRVVFSDEKVFQSSRNGRIRVYRPRNSRFSERYVHNTHNSGRFSVNRELRSVKITGTLFASNYRNPYFKQRAVMNRLRYCLATPALAYTVI
jgi:hypothetical protein